MPDDPTTDEDVRFAAGDAAIHGVLVRGPAPAAGVVLIPDVRGVSELYLRLARRLAGSGLAVLVVDLYSREGGAPDLPDVAAALRWIAALPDERVLGDVDAAVRHLAQRPETRGRVGVAGFCMGGQYALMAACRGAELAACASFYGMLRYDERPPHKPASPLDLAPSLGCPFIGLYGADDPLIRADDRMALEATLRRDRRDFSLHVFGGAGHAFLNDTRPADHRPEAAAVAWRLATDFLRARLLAAATTA